MTISLLNTALRGFRRCRVNSLRNTTAVALVTQIEPSGRVSIDEGPRDPDGREEVEPECRRSPLCLSGDTEESGLAYVIIGGRYQILLDDELCDAPKGPEGP